MNNILGNVAFYSRETIPTIELNLSSYITTDSMLPNKQGKCNSINLPPNSGTCTRFKKGDILVGNIRPYLKKIWFSDIDGGCSADVLVFKTNEGYLPNFIYYALLRDDFFVHAIKGSTGTKMPRGDKDHLLEFLIPDFDYAQQEKISQTLSVLDAKIDLNKKINFELEAMANLIYDYWFMQFDFPDENGNPYKSSGGKMVYNEELKRGIPEGWDVIKIIDQIKLDKTGDWGKEIEEGDYSLQVDCIRGADLNGLNGRGKVKLPNRFILEKNQDKLLSVFDIIIEISGGSPTQSTGRMAFLTDESFQRFKNPLICSNFCKAISLKNNNYFYNFVYLWNNLYSNGVFFGWEGKTSGIKNLLFDIFVNSYQIPEVPETLAKEFSVFVEPLHKKKQKLLLENSELESLREWLLPMLMNGQVKIK